MRHSYEDILTAVGEFGTWQFRRLLSLWTIMLMLGAHYALFQILSFSQDEFICDPPVTANCKLNISRKGEVIANGSKWRFANSRSISIDDKVNKYKYHHVFPRIHRLHHEHENNAGYRSTSGVLSKDLFLTKIQEVFMTNSFCKVHNPFRDENGNCFWNGSSVNQGSYECKTGTAPMQSSNSVGTRPPPGWKWNGGETGGYYHFNPNLRLRYQHRYGFICATFLGRCLINGILTVGMVIGCFTIYILAAKFGRRFALAFSMLATILGYLPWALLLLIESYSFHHVGAYMFFFLANFGKAAIEQICYTYLAEMGSLRKEVFSIGPFSFTYNSFIGTSFAIPFYLGGMLGVYRFFNIKYFGTKLKECCMFTNNVPEFRFYLAVLFHAFIFAIFLVTLLFLPESPIWLLRNKYYGRAKEVLREVAKENNEEVDIKVHPVGVTKKFDLDGAEVKDRVFVTFNNPDKNDVFMETRHYSLAQSFFGAELALITMSIVWCWFMKGLVRVLVDNRGGTGRGEKSANIFYGRRSYELFGIVLLMFLENIFGRRRCLLFLQVFTAFTLLWASIVSHASNPDWDKEYRDEREEFCLNLLALLNAAMSSILIWYCLTIYPTSMR